MVKHQPLQVYERQLCLSCVTGIYGCRWKRYQRSHDDTTKWELLWSVLLLVTFSLLLLWSFFWLEAQNDYSEYNWVLYNRSGEWRDGTAPIIAATAAGFTYVSFLTVLALCHVALGQQLNLYWLHKIGVAVALLCTVGGGISVAQSWSSEWDVVPLSLQASAPFVHIGAAAALAALSWIVAAQVARSERTALQVALLLLYFSVLGAVLTVPLYLTSPCVMEPSDLGPRPEVIAQRGASSLAPENTMWSFQRALHMNISGLQTDVTLSEDGVPFLLRDRVLRRVSDVQEVFPQRQWDDASSFNWTDLQQLNAGRWFLQDDPFGTAWSLSPQERVQIQNQSLCRLTQLLALCSFHNCSLVLRVRRPPAGHPRHYSWINDTLRTLLSSGVQHQLVFWTPDEQRAEVKKAAPGLVQASFKLQSLESLQKNGVSAIFLRYNNVNAQEVRSFSQQQVALTLYTVNKPWLFSLLWCRGVASVCSEAPHVLQKVPQPLWLLRPGQYLVLWLSVDLLCFVVIVAVFIYHNFHILRYRSSGLRSYNPEQIVLNAAVRRTSHDVNVMKEKLLFSGRAVL